MFPDEALRVLRAEHERLLELVMVATDMAQGIQEGEFTLNFANVRKATAAQLRDSIKRRDRAAVCLLRLIDMFERETNEDVGGD